MKKIDRTGESKLNVDGFEMRIIEYNNNKDIIVFFPEFDIIRKTRYRNFSEGKVYPTFRNKGLESIKEMSEFDNVFNDCDTDHLDLGDNKAIAIALSVGMGALFASALGALIYSIVALFNAI